MLTKPLAPADLMACSYNAARRVRARRDGYLRADQDGAAFEIVRAVPGPLEKSLVMPGDLREELLSLLGMPNRQRRPGPAPP